MQRHVSQVQVKRKLKHIHETVLRAVQIERTCEDLSVKHMSNENAETSSGEYSTASVL